MHDVIHDHTTHKLYRHISYIGFVICTWSVNLLPTVLATCHKRECVGKAGVPLRLKDA